MQTISPVHDIMNYYVWCFSAYVFAFAIVIINTVKTYLDNRRPDSRRDSVAPDIAVTILCGLIMVSGVYFLAILADNGGPGANDWSNGLIAMGGISFLLFLFQLYWGMPRKKNQ